MLISLLNFLFPCLLIWLIRYLISNHPIITTLFWTSTYFYNLNSDKAYGNWEIGIGSLEEVGRGLVVISHTDIDELDIKELQELAVCLFCLLRIAAFSTIHIPVPSINSSQSDFK
jgi:hypothetical protein